MKNLQTRKGAIAIGDVPNIIRVMIAVGIFLAIGMMILQAVRDTGDQPFNNTAITHNGSFDGFTQHHNVTNAAMSGLNVFSEWQSIIWIAVAAGVVLGLIAFLRS